MSGRPATAATPVSRQDPAAANFDLQDLLSHLLRRAHFFAEAEFAAVYDGFDLTSRQLALLFAIHRQPGSSQTELAEACGFDLNTLSDLAKRSERHGWLRRVRSLDDRRAFGLFLTEQGQALFAEALARTWAYQNRLTAGRLDDDETHQLKALLRKMLGLQASHASPPS